MDLKIVEKFQLKDGGEIVFRYPTMEDAPLMMNYINTLSKEQTFINFQGEQISLEKEQKRLSDLLVKIEKKRAVQLLVFCNSELIAISDLIMRDRAEKFVGSFGITVAKEFRGVGLGKKLMQLVLEEAIKNLPDLKIVVLGVFGDNPIAQNLYKEMGFVQYGELHEGLTHQDHLDDHIYMYKKIRD